MYSDIKLKEFDWYLRDLFFRTNKNNNNDKEIENFSKEEIAKFLIKNYLRYRNSGFDEISNLLNMVLDDMQKNNILIVDNEIIKIHSNFNRKQCAKCFYINYLSLKEAIHCRRCDSDNLQEFPKKKNMK
jgi:ribosomal protein L40E